MRKIRALLIATALIALAGCATNPVMIAKTTEQKAYAVYGQYVIIEEQAAEFICGPESPAGKCPGNPLVPDSVRATVKEIDARASPVVATLLDTLEQGRRIQAQLMACDTSTDPACKPDAQALLRVANANLINWINQLLPLIAQLKSSVGR